MDMYMDNENYADNAAKRLNELMNEYLAIKKIEREVNFLFSFLAKEIGI